MPRPRSTYTAEFKLRAVRMVTEQKLSVAEVARRLDIGENLLRGWRKAFLAKGGDAFPGHGHPTPAEDELRRLRAENACCGPSGTCQKKPPRTSPARRADVPVHRRPNRRAASHLDVRGVGGVGQRVLRLGRPGRRSRGATAAGVGRGDRGGPRRREAPVREPADARGVERPRPRLLGEHGGQAHVSPGNPCPHPQAVRPHDRLPAPPAGGRECPGS